MNDQAFITPSLPWTKSSTRTAKTSTSPLRMSENESEKKPVVKGPPLESGATWQYDVFPGFKSKGSGSRPGFDLRPKSLKVGEENVDVCSSCKGTGIMTCTFCEGVNFNNVDGTLRNCPACKNKKDVTCCACFGTAKQIELVSF